MMWPTLGLRSAREQKRTVFLTTSIDVFLCVLCVRPLDCSMRYALWSRARQFRYIGVVFLAPRHRRTEIFIPRPPLLHCCRNLVINDAEGRASSSRLIGSAVTQSFHVSLSEMPSSRPNNSSLWQLYLYVVCTQRYGRTESLSSVITVLYSITHFIVN